MAGPPCRQLSDQCAGRAALCFWAVSLLPELPQAVGTSLPRGPAPSSTSLLL